MCVDFTNLNNVFPKDSYPLPNIECLVERVTGCELLSSMDAYFEYNQIRMHSKDKNITILRAKTTNYYY